MPNPSVAEQRVALERDRLEFEKAQAHRAQAASTSFLRNHLGATISAAGVILAAVVASIVSGTQVWTANIAKQKEIEITTLQNNAKMDRRWRVEMLGFLERHEQQLFSKDPQVTQHALTFLELSFPAQYAQPARSKLNILGATTIPSQPHRVLEELLKPLIVQFDRTEEAFMKYQPGNLSAENVLRDGNEKARDLLLAKRELIPEALRDDGARLVEHYEVWLQQYSRLRNNERSDASVPVFAGPVGYPFPIESARRFREELNGLVTAIGSPK
jgi:hypothetical protein